MNDGHDPLYFARTYTDPKSQQARDRWLAHREAHGMPVIQSVEKFATIPPLFARQFAAMRDRRK